MSDQYFIENEAALKANKLAAQHGIDLSKLPNIMNMSTESITENVIAINSNCPDDRMKFIFEKLVTHIHSFVKETSLTSDEWLTAIKFLTETGQKCTDLRQEFILVSDTLGITTLVDSINNAKPSGASEGTVLGPFFTEDAVHIQNGSSIASEGKGNYLWVQGRILNTKGDPISNACIDTWETDGHGLYDTQYANRTEPDCRGRLWSDQEGRYSFRAIVPVPYPIPGDGPVGKMITKLGRHPFRPAHLHMMIDAPGYEKLTTALYMNGDPYLKSDAVFGVKSSLIVEPKLIKDTKTTLERGFKEAKEHMELIHDFVLATPEEGLAARKKLMVELK